MLNKYWIYGHVCMCVYVYMNMHSVVCECVCVHCCFCEWMMSFFYSAVFTIRIVSLCLYLCCFCSCIVVLCDTVIVCDCVITASRFPFPHSSPRYIIGKTKGMLCFCWYLTSWLAFNVFSKCLLSFCLAFTLCCWLQRNHNFGYKCAWPATFSLLCVIVQANLDSPTNGSIWLH